MQYHQIKRLFCSLNAFEKKILQGSRDDFEQAKNIRFINLECYVIYLANAVLDRQHKGEFVPRSIEEARAGRNLIITTD
jgi:hypothetical protein